MIGTYILTTILLIIFGAIIGFLVELIKEYKEQKDSPNKVYKWNEIGIYTGYGAIGGLVVGLFASLVICGNKSSSVLKQTFKFFMEKDVKNMKPSELLNLLD
jgi:hypothetical protein